MNQMTLMEAFDWHLGTGGGDGFNVDLYNYATGSQFEIPFIPDNTTATHLDFYYYLSWSGDKIISPALEKIMEQFEDWTSVEARTAIAGAFWTIYGEQLIRQWENFTREYDPIEDYHVTEVTSYTHEGSGASVENGGGSDKWSGSINNEGKTKTTDSVSTYDGTTKEVSTSVTEYDGQNDTAKNKTTYDNLTDTKSHSNRRDSEESATDDLHIEKSGNLGITPLSQFLKDDIELWKMNFYKKIFFPALDSFLTIPIY